MTNEQMRDFETWYEAEYKCRPDDFKRFSDADEYIDPACNADWQVWQAATLKATQVERERCALLAEAYWFIDGSFTSKEFADAIRLPMPSTGAEQETP